MTLADSIHHPKEEPLAHGVNPANPKSRTTVDDHVIQQKKCKEKREAEEIGIGPEITSSVSGEKITLMDVEEGKLTAEDEQRDKTEKQETPKIKRCPKRDYVGATRNPPLSAYRMKSDPLPVVKRESIVPDRELCKSCMGQPICRYLHRCDECNKYCKPSSPSIDDVPALWGNETVGMASRTGDSKGNNIFSKTLYPIRTYREGDLKDIICKITGITNTEDIETVIIWVTTYSNKPPTLPDSIDESKSKDIETQQNLPGQKFHQSDREQPNHVGLSNDLHGLPETDTNNGHSGHPELKPRFNDYDVDEDVDPSENRNIEENFRENPDLIEGPPPLLGSSNKGNTLIVQPKELESADSDEFDNLPTATVSAAETEEPTTKIFAKPSLLSRLKALTTPRINTFSTHKDNDVRPSAGISTSISDMNKALQDVKKMVQNIQEEAQMASGKRLLGASNTKEAISKDVDDINHQPADVIPSVVPQHVVENLKKVNKYIINRAQDTLDTIGNAGNNEGGQPVDSNLTEDDHSAITKKIITDFKKMPQFLLNNYKDALNRFDTNHKSSSTLLDEKNPESIQDEVKMSRRFGEDVMQVNDIETTTEPLVGFAEPTDIKGKNSSSKNYKTKLEKYRAELKEKRQKMYSPEKYINHLSKKPENESKNIDSDDSIINLLPKNVMKNQDSSDSTLQSSNKLNEQRMLLRSKLKKYIDDALSKKTSIVPDSRSFVEATKPSVQKMESQPLNKPNVISGSAKLDNYSQSLSTENPEQVVGDPNLIHSNGISHFLPTIPSAPKYNKIQPNKFIKYLENVKEKMPLIRENILNKTDDAADINEQLNATESKKNLLKEKIKQYVENLKKPVNGKIPETIVSRNKPQDIVGNPQNNLDSSAQDLKMNILKNKLKDYVDSLKQPLKNRMSLPAETKKMSELIRKSPEVQKAELNGLKKKLENLLKERTARISKFSLPSNPLIAEAQPNQDDPVTEIISSGDPEVSLVKSGTSIQNRPLNIMNMEEDNDRISNIKLGDSPVQMLDVQNPSNNLIVDQSEANLQSRGQFTTNDDPVDWSNNLGKIVQPSSKKQDLFFIGSGIKLPLQIKQSENGSVDIAVDLDKLCSCYNSTCPKNRTAIEETVGAILEKEAELEDQLRSSPDVSSDAIKSVPISPNGLKNSKSNIFKRSSEMNGLRPELTTLRNVLEFLKKEEKKRLLGNPEFQATTTDLTHINNQIQKSVSNSIHKLEDNVQKVNEEVAHTLENFQIKPSRGQQFTRQQVEANLRKIQHNTNKIKNNFIKEFQHQTYPNTNIIKTQAEVNKYIENLEREKKIKNLLLQSNTAGVPTTGDTLRQIENEVNSLINNIERKETLRKMMKNAEVIKAGSPKLSSVKNHLIGTDQLKENVKNSLLEVPKLQGRFAELNGNLIGIPDAFQRSKIPLLENKLQQLNNKVKEYEEENEKMIAEESKKYFGDRRNEVVDKEVTLIGNILSWFKGLTKSENTE